MSGDSESLLLLARKKYIPDLSFIHPQRGSSYNHVRRGWGGGETGRNKGTLSFLFSSTSTDFFPLDTLSCLVKD